MSEPTALRARPQVPSEREAAAGVAPSVRDVNGDPAEVVDADGGTARARRSLRGLLDDLRPGRLFEGAPVLPFIVLALFGFVTQWDDAVIGVLLPEIRSDLATDLTFILTMQAVLGVVLFQLVAPLFGFMADRFKRVWMLRIGALMANASAVVTAFAPGVGVLMLGRAGMNLGNAVLNPVGLPLIADYYPSRVRARLFSLLGGIGYAGAFAGPIIGGSLGAAFGWRIAVLVLGGLALGVSLLAFLLREPARGYQDRLEMGADEAAAAREQPPIGWSEGWRIAGGVATIRRLWYSAPFLAAIGFAVLGLMGFYYTEEFGVGPQGRGIIAAAGFGAGFVALLFAGPIGDRVIAARPGRVMTLMGGVLVVQAGVFVILWAAPSLAVAVAVNLALAFINGLFLPALYTMLSLTVPARIRGLGIMSVGPWQALGALAVPLVGPIAASAGFRPAMLVFVPICLIAAVILGTGAAGVDRDIAAAKATALAEEASMRAREEGGAPLLVCRGVEVAYDGVQVLFGVDLDVHDGEIVALLGTNGAGKSTLLRAISGVDQASGGAIFYDGRDITHMPPHRNAVAGIVMLPGGRAIFPTLTVAENLRAVVAESRAAEAGGDEIEDVLEAFPALRARMDVQAGALSGGEQQMLALGQAFLMRPRLLMIDELSLGLSPAIVEQLLATLERIHARGTTIVLVEQSVNLALTIAHRAVFLEKGAVRFDGPTAELVARGDLVRSVFLGGAVTGADLTGRPASARAHARDRARVLEVQDLSVHFGGVAALDGVSLHLDEREIVGIIGPNGAGKTTLFDAISGATDAATGRVVVAGTDVSASPAHERARLGLTRSFQNARLFPTMTIRDAVAVAFDHALAGEHALAAAVWSPKVRKAERTVARRIDVLLDLLGLADVATRRLSVCSTAMRRVVDIACVTAASPKVLLLDEPSSGLAQSEAEELGPLLRRLVRETGCGVLIIEHDIPLVTGVSDRMIAMDLGRVIVEGDPATVVNHPSVVRAALGGRDDVIARSGARRT